MRAKDLHSAFSDNVTFILWNEAAIESSKKPVDLTSSKVAGNVVYNFYIGQNPA